MLSSSQSWMAGPVKKLAKRRFHSVFFSHVLTSFCVQNVFGRENEVYVSVPKDVPGQCNVIFFPGDVQDFKTAMYCSYLLDNIYIFLKEADTWFIALFFDRMAGPFTEYCDYAYEAVADLLSQKFGDSSNVWVVRPSRFKHGAYSSFDNFVTSNDYGAATGCKCFVCLHFICA